MKKFVKNLVKTLAKEAFECKRIQRQICFAFFSFGNFLVNEEGFCFNGGQKEEISGNEIFSRGST
jgi:hypothetical protein